MSRLDVQTDAVRQTKTGHRPLGVAVTGGQLWLGLELSAAEGRAQIEGDRVLNAAVAEDVGTTDPAAASDPWSLAFAQALGGGLMRYRPAVNGIAEIVPDLAARGGDSLTGVRQGRAALAPALTSTRHPHRRPA